MEYAGSEQSKVAKDAKMNTQSMLTKPVDALGSAIGLNPIPFNLPKLSAMPRSRSRAQRESRSQIKSASFVNLYRFLRAHHQWTLFHAVRYALWLTR